MDIHARNEARTNFEQNSKGNLIAQSSLGQKSSTRVFKIPQTSGIVYQAFRKSSAFEAEEIGIADLLF